MKKKIYTLFMLFFMLVLGIQTSHSQNACQTPESNIPSAGERIFNLYVNWFKAWGGHLNTDLKTIPVIIHVIYKNNAERQQISRSRIEGQIEVTNKQLRRLNANAINTRPIFLPVAADCNLKVVLAARNNGVIYHRHPDFLFSRDFRNIQAASMVNPARYLNVWVVFGQLAGGGATFPWDKTPIQDGFWIGAQNFGTTGANLSPHMNGGTTFAHELAHYLGVLHTHDNPAGYRGQCDRAHDGTIADYCADTPLDWSDPASPEQCEIVIATECEPELVCQSENYMYYNQDSCTNMFSKDQRARMRACLQAYRPLLALSSHHGFKGIDSEDFDDQPGDKPVLEKQITISPNPTSGIVHINYQDLVVKNNMVVRIYNQLGVKLKELYSRSAINELNLGSFAEGLYYIKITIDNVSVTKYVIKAGSELINR